MKKKKIFLSLILGIIAMIALSIQSKAVTLTTSETPTTVYSGQKFKIVMSFDEEVFSASGYLGYDSSLVTLKKPEDSKVDISPEYSKNVLAWIYAPNENATTKRIEVDATAANVDEEKVVEFKTSDVVYNSGKDQSEGTIADQTFKVTIKPNKDLSVGKTEVSLKKGETETITAEGNGKLTWKSSNENIAKVEDGKITAISEGTATITVTDEAGKTKEIKVTVSDANSANNENTNTNTNTGKTNNVDNSTFNGEKIAKAGESKAVLILAIVAIVIAVILGKKSHKINKLFVMLPLLFAISFAGNTSNAATADIKDVQTDKIDVGLFTNLADMEGKNVIAVSARSGFRKKNINDETGNKLLYSDLTEFFNKNTSIKITSINGETSFKDSLVLKTGDKLKDSNNKEYTIVLFGNINSQGTVCTGTDLKAIKYIFLGQKKDDEDYTNYKEEKRLALNLRYQTENGKPVTSNGKTIIDALDASRCRYKALGQDGGSESLPDLLNGTLIYETIYNPETTSEGNFELTQEGQNAVRYKTLKQAIDAAGTKTSTIKVLDNASSALYPTITVTSQQNITLDLNGKELQLGGNGALVVENKLTIKDTGENGILSRSASTSTPTCISGKDGSEIIVESGTIKSPGYAVGGDKITINGGTLQSSGSYAVYGKDITINNVTISKGLSGIAVSESGKLVFNNGVITNTKYGISAGKDAKITVNDGKIEGKVAINGAENAEVEVNGGTINGLASSSNEDKYSAVSVKGIFKMTSGTINGASGSKGAIEQTKIGYIDITGGTISSGWASDYAIYQDVTTGAYRTSISISGARVSGFNYGIYQKGTSDIIIDYNYDKDVATSISQISSQSQSSENAAIYKDDSGDIQIGKTTDIRAIGELLMIEYKSNGINAPEATVKFYNGCIKPTNAALGKAILSARDIILNSTPTFEHDFTVQEENNKKYVNGSMLYTPKYITNN